MFLNLATTIATLSMGAGLVRYVAEHRSTGDQNRLGGIIHSAVTIQIGLAVVLVIGVLVAVRPLSQYLFGSVAYAPWLSVVALAVPFVVLASGIGESLFFGFHDYGTYTRVAILTVMGGLVPFVVLIALYGISGAFISMVVVALWGAGLSLYYLYRRIPFRPLIRPRLVLRETKALLSYGAASFFAGTAGLLALLYMRSLVVQKLGAEQNGFYHVVYALHSYYFLLLTNGLWGHFYPTMCQADSNEFRVGEINRTIRFSLLCLVPIVAVLLAFRTPIVYLIFSKEFLPAVRLFPLQLLGDGFFLIGYILSTSLLSMGALRAYAGLSFGQYFLLIIVFWFLMPRLGVLGLVGAYAASNAVFAVLNYAYHVKVIGLRFVPKNRHALGWSLATLIAMALVPGGSVYTMVVPMVLLGIWALLVVERHEVSEAVAMVQSWLAPTRSQEPLSSDGS
jgi:PST family polysaccharide transporter